MQRMDDKRDKMATKYAGGTFGGGRPKVTKNTPASALPGMTDLEAMRAALLGGGGGSRQQQQQEKKGKKVKPSRAETRGVKKVKISNNGISLRQLAIGLAMKQRDVMKLLENLGESFSDAAYGDEGDVVVDADVAELAVLELGVTVVRVEDKDEALMTTGAVPYTSHPSRNRPLLLR